MAWIQTSRGRKFWFAASVPFDICIEDIAHALSHLCRFTGHTTEFYSVAQHSVLVSDNCPAEHRLAGLMHDAHEAYIGDISSPMKRWMYDEWRDERFDMLERRIQYRVLAHFGLPLDVPHCVKLADGAALATEARDLFDNSPLDEWTNRLPPPFTDNIDPLPPRGARELFMERFGRLVTNGAAT